MNNYDSKVDAYIEKAAGFAKPVLTHIRELIHTTCPDVEEVMKWSFPNFMYNGAILCNMAAFKEHCAFGFWKASLMTDSENILEKRDKEGMGHIGKITSLKDLPKDSVFKKYIREAMKLNEEGVKIPKKKPSEKDKQELRTPDYLQKALKKNKQAEKVFNDFSYSKKKEYIQWLEEAKTEATREKRMTEAVEWIAEGKSRNWKYMNC